MSSFEKALQKTQTDIETAVNAAQSALNALKRARKNVLTGDIKPLARQLDAIDATLQKLAECTQAVRDGWDFDLDSYFGGPEFMHDVMQEAERLGVSIHEMDGRLFCYPCILKPVPADYAVMIDKKREKRVRPAFFASLLQQIQNKPAKFRPDAFLESIYAAYRIIGEQKFGRTFNAGSEIQLLEIYRVLTLLPGQQRDYSRQEFARDVYLLDQSHVVVTRDGHRASFQGSTGTRSPLKCLRIVTRDGNEQVYYTISFMTDAGE